MPDNPLTRSTAACGTDLPALASPPAGPLFDSTALAPQPSPAVCPDEIDVPIPPRYWWLKRLSWASAVFVVFLVLLRLWWGWEAQRRLQAEIAKYRAEGGPVLVEEFDAELDAVPEEENAAVLYERAMKNLVLATPSGIWIQSFADDPNLFATNMAAAAELLKLNEEVLSWVRQARERSKVVWNERVSDWFRPGFIPPYGTKRMLRRLLRLAVEYHVRTNNHAEAVEWLHDFLDFNEAIGAHPTLLAHLVRSALHVLCFDLIGGISPKLELKPFGSSAQGEGVVSVRRRVDDLIARLLDEGRPRQSIRNALRGEAAFSLGHFTHAGSKPWRAAGATSGSWMPSTDWPILPVYVLDTIRAVRRDRSAADVVSGETAAQALSRVVEPTAPGSLVQSLIHPLSRYGHTRTLIEVHYSELALRRMAAIALAIRLYTIDHGVLPDQLSELVPSYLPRVPLDPLSEEKGEIRYLRHVENPVIYTVWRNGRDDGGRDSFRARSRKERESSDYVFYLRAQSDSDGDDDSLAPSAQTSENNEQPKDGKGQDDEQQPQQPAPK